MTKQKRYDNTFMINVPTPDGALWVHIVKEDDGKIHRIFTSAGKCGASFNAWAAAYAHLLTLFVTELVYKNPDWSLARLATEISGFNTDRFRTVGNGINIKSGPEGMAYAIRQYQQDLAEQTLKEIKANAKTPRFKVRVG